MSFLRGVRKCLYPCTGCVFGSDEKDGTSLGILASKFPAVFLNQILSREREREVYLEKSRNAQSGRRK